MNSRSRRRRRRRRERRDQKAKRGERYRERNGGQLEREGNKGASALGAPRVR